MVFLQRGQQRPLVARVQGREHLGLRGPGLPQQPAQQRLLVVRIERRRHLGELLLLRRPGRLQLLT
jgi:hypothetical protein